MEEDSSFVVRDRRSQISKEGPQEKKSASDPTIKTKSGTTEDDAPGHARHSPPDPHAGHNVRIDFSSFILSLGSSALIHLGEEADPETGQKSVILPNAKQAIDLISLLKEKTAGNLNEAEDRLISQLLFTLRMKFVEIEKKRSS